MIPREHHWQPALGGNGEVTGLEDLRQAIAIILRTPRGSDPLRPEFGSNLHLYIDYPVNRARPHLVRETVDAPIRNALSNSFGFGGTNASLVLRRWDGK